MEMNFVPKSAKYSESSQCHNHIGKSPKVFSNSICIKIPIHTLHSRLLTFKNT